jgi:hypothetical protein
MRLLVQWIDSGVLYSANGAKVEWRSIVRAQEMVLLPIRSLEQQGLTTPGAGEIISYAVSDVTDADPLSSSYQKTTLWGTKISFVSLLSICYPRKSFFPAVPRS